MDTIGLKNDLLDADNQVEQACKSGMSTTEVKNLHAELYAAAIAKFAATLVVNPGIPVSVDPVLHVGATLQPGIIS